MFFFVYSEASNEAFKSWSEHDEAQNKFCELDGKFYDILNLEVFYVLFIAQKGMLTTFPQCNFSLEFLEILSENHIYAIID